MNYILIFILFFSTLHATSSDFSLIINKQFNDSLFDITQDYDRGISAIGFTKNYNTSSSNSVSYSDPFNYLKSISNKNGSQITLIKVDDSAKVVLNKSTNLSKINEAVSIIKLPSNGYIIGGHTLDGSLLILKLDSNGNTIYTKIFGTKKHDKMSKIIALDDGGVLAIATSSTSRSAHDNLFETGLGLNDIYISRFSKDGKKLWSKKYGTMHDDKSIDAVEADDGTLIILSVSSYDNNQNVMLMRVSENGDKIWLKTYESDTKVTPYKIIKLRDNNFLVSLSWQNELRKQQIKLIKFDLQNNILIDKNIDTTYSSVLKDIKEFSDGKIIGVGYVKDLYNTDALVMVVNNELELLNQEHYGEENFDMFNAVTILHNSQVAVAGIHTDNNSQESNMWIVKLNQDATIAQKSIKIVDFYDELRKIFKDEIDSNKIVIKKDLSIEFIDKLLVFKVGVYKLTHVQEKFLSKFSKKLIPFLNANKDFVDTLEINGHSSSEWGKVDFTNQYLNNEKLSMNRAYSALSHIFKNQTHLVQVWLSNILRGSGFSSSKKIILNKTEDKEKSRRISFKIIIKLNQNLF